MPPDRRAESYPRFGGVDADVLAAVDQLLKLDPVRARLRLRRLLPDPCHEGGWARLWHADLARMTSAERRQERWRLMVAVALAGEDDRVPDWVLERLGRLSTPPVSGPSTPSPSRRAETGEKPAGTEPGSGGFPMGWVR